MAYLNIPIDPSVEDNIRQMLEGLAREVITKTAESAINSKKYLSLSETCKYIGISPNTLTKWVHEEDLPVIHIQGKKFIDKNTLHEFLKSYEK